MLRMVLLTSVCTMYGVRTLCLFLIEVELQIKCQNCPQSKPHIKHSPANIHLMINNEPQNAFHTLRWFLLQNGIDTHEIISRSDIPLPQASVDEVNSFCFEFNKQLIPDDRSNPVNVSVLYVRCFMEEDKETLHAQLVLNHHRDAVFELNEVYDHLIMEAVSDDWATSSESRRITLLEKTYTDTQDFKAFILKLKTSLSNLKTYACKQ